MGSQIHAQLFGLLAAGDVDAFFRTFRQNCAAFDVNALVDNKTLLIEAIWNRHLALIIYLLDVGGARVDVPDERFRSPLRLRNC